MMLSVVKAPPLIPGRSLIVPAVVLACILVASKWSWVAVFPKAWELPIAAVINKILDLIVPLIAPATAAASHALAVALAGLVQGLQFIPWPATTLVIALIGFRAGGPRLLVLCLTATCYIVFSGFWQQSMATVSLVILAVPMSVLCGFLLGLGAFLMPNLRSPVEVLFDFMQTFPAFAYLIPLLLLFGFGPVAGLVATAVYAIPPIARCTLSGLLQVVHERVEVAEMAGCTLLQRLLWVELPSAAPMVLVGVNQTTMAALSMVITASIIGGFDDVGWAVLSGLRQADLGKSLLAGLVIVLISIVVDRVSAEGFANGRIGGTSRRRKGSSFVLLAVPIILCAGAIARWAGPGLLAGQNDGYGLIDFGGLNSLLLDFVARYSAALDAIKNGVLYCLILPLRLGLAGAAMPITWGFAMTPTITGVYAILVTTIAISQLAKGRYGQASATLSLAMLLYVGFVAFPWPAAILLITWFAWRGAGPKLALFTALSLVFVLLSGLWIPFVKSLYLVSVAVALCMAVGGFLGVIAAHSDRLSAILRPLNDALQTIPQFVFLIPALMFFKVGEFAGLIAISLYAIAPAIRYTEAGLRNVSPAVLETAKQLGCTPTQSNLLVQIPLARPALLLGLNQTVMAAITMLPIAATVGTSELGQQIYIALGKADAGLGVTAGIVFCLTAICLDRLLRAAAGHLRSV